MKPNVCYKATMSSKLKMTPSPENERVLAEFIRAQTLYDYMNRDTIRTPAGDLVLAAPAPKDIFFLRAHHVIYLPTTTMERLLQHFKYAGVDFDVVETTKDDFGADINITTKDITLYKAQDIAYEKIFKANKRGGRCHLLGLLPGAGKALALDTIVPMSDGSFKRHGDLAVGDCIIGSVGLPTCVTAVYPQPMEFLYDVLFGDNSSIKAHPDHLWDIEVDGKTETMTTTDMRMEMGMGDMYVPSHTGWHGGRDVALALRPQVLAMLYKHGVALDTDTPYLSNLSSTEYKQLLDNLPAHVYCVPSRKSGNRSGLYRFFHTDTSIKDHMIEMGMDGEMCIPDCYKQSTRVRRQELFDAMIYNSDTTGDILYETYSETLAYDLRSLGCSLGIDSRVLKVSDDALIPLSSHKPIFRLIKVDSQRSREIRAITIDVDAKESNCITVDAKDKLYMVGDTFKLTHNTFTSLKMAADRNKRIMVFSKPGYIDQWTMDVAGVVENADVCNIKGTDMLLKVLEAAVEGNYHDIYLLSLATYRSYVKRWVENDQRITIPPPDMTATLQIGTIIADETHQEMKPLFHLISCSNVSMLIGLSGTMSSDEAIIRQAMVDMFPVEDRYIDKNAVPYIKLVYYYYGFHNPSQIVCNPRGRTTYSHVAFEKWLLRNKSMFNKYCHAICDAFEKGFMSRRQRGDRCLIFVAKVDTAAALEQLMRVKYARDNLSFINFTGSVKKEATLGKIVIISTVGKSGTAIDHLGLTTIIQTVAVNKKETAQQNIQRLRVPKLVKLAKYDNYMDDRERMMIQLMCADISAHERYARNRSRSIASLITTQQQHFSDFVI